MMPQKSQSSDCQLNKRIIIQNLPASVAKKLESLQVFDVTTSTNDRLMNHTPDKLGRFIACIANQQTAGRGRNGHDWHSPADANIYMSIAVKLDGQQMGALNGLSLASGVSLARVFEAMGLNVGIKWPNDILSDDKKLAGILVETRVKARQVLVVVGVGVNVAMPEQADEIIDQPWTDLTSLMGRDSVPDRNQLAAQLLAGLIQCLIQYIKGGFDSFAQDWKKYDLLRGRDVIIKSGEAEFSAKVLGVNNDLGLKVQVNEEEKVLYAADIKLKLSGKSQR